MSKQSQDWGEAEEIEGDAHLQGRAGSAPESEPPYDACPLGPPLAS